MTNKEAKATLSVFQEEILDTLWLSMEQRKGLAEALDLAINALEEAEDWHNLKLVCANDGIVVYKVKGEEE